MLGYTTAVERCAKEITAPKVLATANRRFRIQSMSDTLAVVYLTTPAKVEADLQQAINSENGRKSKV